MAKAAARATTLTTLVIGSVEVAVGLFSSQDKPGKLAEFDTGGPNGGVLKARSVARAVPVGEVTDLPDEPVHSDPLGDEPQTIEDALGAPAHSVAGQPGEPWSEHPQAMIGAIAIENARRVEQAPDRATAAREALAAEAEGDARARGHAEAVAEPGAVVADAIEGKRPLEDASDVLDEFDPLIDAGAPDTSSFPVGPGLFSHTEVAGEYGRELVEEGTDLVVLPQDVRRGVRLEDGRFIDCTEQLAKIDKETKLDNIRVITFVNVGQVQRARVRGALYVGAADEKAPPALRLIFESLRRKRRVAVVKVTKRSRQTLGVIGWLGDALVLYELVWSEDFRPAPKRATMIQQAQVHEAQIDRMCALIDAMSDSATAIDEVRDDALALRETLHAKAVAGEVAEVLTPTPVDQDEQDIMAQLEASLAMVSS